MAISIVSFDAAEFVALYPRFETVNPIVLQNAFYRSETHLANTKGSIVPVNQRKALLYLATAHILVLDERGAEAVGQVTSASEGSESVSLASLPSQGQAQAYWNQTTYGAEFFMATRKYCSFLIV